MIGFYLNLSTPLWAFSFLLVVGAAPAPRSFITTAANATTNNTNNSISHIEPRNHPVPYILFHGDGSPNSGWPTMEEFMSLDELVAVNSDALHRSCGYNNWGPDNTEQEIIDIKQAVQKVALESGVDARFIFAIIMQESKGCVRAPTTDNGVVNPGLMQCHNGDTSCAGEYPCPAHKIENMVREGTRGTPSGEGLEQILASVGEHSGGQRMFGAARKYNSGSVDWSNLNNGFTSTACYASDVANRLRGWAAGSTGCQL